MSKNGVSSKELQRQLGVTYKTAWRIGAQIRSLMKQGSDLLSGIVEADETYIGGERQRKLGSFQNKTPIMGMAEREGKVKAEIIPNRETHIILNSIKKNVAKGSRLMTDDFRVYQKTPKLGYERSAIKHSKKQYVLGDVHTNTIEGFWSHVKRSLTGTYCGAVSKKHLQTYVDQLAFSRNYPSAFGELVGRI